MKKRTQAAGFLAALFLFLLASCEPAQPKRPLLWYGEHTFPFEMTLSSPNSEGEPVILTGRRTPDSVTVSVVSPERMQGLTVRYANGNTVLSAGSTEIPLSREAAEGLTCLLDGLLVRSADGAKLGSTEEGSSAVTFDTLTLVLDENGLPQSIRDTETGREAGISIQIENLSDETNKDQQNNEYQTENRGGDF